MKKLIFSLLLISSLASYGQKKNLVTNKGEIVPMEKYDSAAVRTLINAKVNISDTAAMLSPYLRTNIAAATYATVAALALKLNISDTAVMLSPYLRSNVAAATYATIVNLALKLNISDTAGMLSPYLRSNIAAATYATIANLALKLNISDTAAMLLPYLQKIDTTAMLSTYLRTNIAAATYTPLTRTISTTSPLAGGGDLSANRTLTINNAAADNTTKGAASFTSTDFDASVGNISIDYTNGQAASASAKGFLTAADWSTFNGKQNTITNPVTGTGTTNYVPKWASSTSLGNSLIYDDGTHIGIGTTTPAYLFQVRTGTNHNFDFNDAGGAGTHMFSLNDAANAYVPFIIDGDPLVLNNYSLAKTGIGTLSPQSKLDIIGGVRIGQATYSPPTSGEAFELYYDNADNGANFMSINRTGNVWKKLNIRGSDVYLSPTNVGVGIGLASASTTPSAKLHVFGNTYLDNSTATELTFNTTGTNYVHFYDAGISSSGGGLAIGGTASISTTPTTATMFWNTNTGNVSMGTTTPNAGSLSGGTILTIKGNTSGARGALELVGNIIAGANEIGTLVFTHNTTKLVRVEALRANSQDNSADFTFSTSNAGSEATRLTLKYNGDIWMANNGGNVGVGTTSPTAVLHLKAGTATASTAPLKLTSGTNLTTTEAGAIEYNGTHLYFTAANAGTRYQLDQQLTAGTVTSGTYTPTLTGVTNITSSTAANCQYTRVGNIVTVFGSLAVTTTLAVSSELDISLPVASNLAATTDANGTGSPNSSIAQNIYIDGDATNDRVRLNFLGLSVGGAGNIFFSFSYTVL